MLQCSDFKNKTVLIMGLGLHGGGAGSAAFFARLGSRVIVTVLKSRGELAPSVAKLKRFQNITYHLGGHWPADFTTADFVINGPGVPENSKFLKVAKRAGVPILSDVEIFFLTCPAPIIGITGTKGKSTTTWLLGEFLERGLERRAATGEPRRRRVWVGGNIRKSMLAFLPRVRANDLVVLELSSFQLDSLKRQRRSPHVALITSIFPDHLNRYPSMNTYAASKAAIFRFQKSSDVLFIPSGDRRLDRLAKSAPGRVIQVRPASLRRLQNALRHPPPSHHLPNIALAVAAARYLGVGESVIRRVLGRFRGMPGRMELVRRVGGVAFINDTTATNPRAAKEAVIVTKRRIGAHGLHVIAGGYDKGLPVREFTNALTRQAASVVWLPGTATRNMKSEIRTSRALPMFDAKRMSEAVRVAYRNARSGDVVLLSPGAASFGLFRHEFDRGEQFVHAAKALRERTS
jgi:UDP-N-acetylmuramoylalanine--D-glutamate ligase